MAFDLKQFAIVARATNSIYFYVTEADTLAQATTATYFNNKDLTGYVKKGDIILINAKDKFAIAKVTAVDIKAGTITYTKSLAETTSSGGGGS